MQTKVAGDLVGGRYRLVDRVGHGGMGTVWQARDEVLGRTVAIKEVEPPPELNAEERHRLRERTLREARAAARLSSAHAVTVYDVVEQDGHPWIVMEWLEAPTLADEIRDHGPLPVAEVAEIGLSVLGGLRAAHTSGVLHRDVKPSNVMLTESGAVLTDFGIAYLEGDPDLTSTGMLVGSPSYMAPERARGEPASAASDLWSLGATLYAAVEGTGPFDRPGQLPTLHAVLNEDVPDPVRAGALAPVICALLAKDPARRPSLDQARRMLVKAAREGTMAETEPLPAPDYAAVFPEGERAQAMAPVVVPPPAVPVTEVSPLDPAQASGTDGRVRGSRTPTALLLSALVLLAALVVAGLYLVLHANTGPTLAQASTNRTGSHSTGRPAGRNTHPAGTHPASHAPSTTPTPTPSTPTTPSPTNSATTAPAGTSTSGSGGVPAGYVLHKDPTGYRVAVPAGWVERPSGGTYTDFVDPQTGGFLRVDQTSTPQPNPAADWRSHEPYVAKQLPGYRRISIAPVSYRGWKAADWEFTWHGANGPIHVLDRGFVTGPDHGYALYWSMPQSAWKQSLQQFQVVADSFQPAS